MHLYPEDISEKLEFERICQLLSDYCCGDPARQMILDMRVFNNRVRIERMLDEVQEFQKCLDLGYVFPLSQYNEIGDELVLLSKVDYVLELEQYLSIFDHIRIIRDIRQFFDAGEHVGNLPLLTSISDQIELNPEMIRAFESVFNEEGKIKPDASPELRAIIKATVSKERELNKIFGQLIEKYRKSGYLTDNYESVKNSRRVLSVAAEFKRKIKGVVHDESSTGKTVFIEPQEILQVNNELFDLDAQKRQEVYRILRGLSASIRPYISDLELWQKILLRYDVIRAKALFAQSYNGRRPDISEDRSIKIHQARHPLLYLKNKEMGKPTVAFSLELNSEKRMLVISGPNAGGKSVTLKTIGLCQLMLQAGLLIPVEDNSSIPVYSKLMIDIGDQQSIEGDLSTYSSRLLHMKHFVSSANKNTLVLIDEFGSGSDPKMGGAIAEAVLDSLVSKRCFAVITTHYSNIKNYAFRSENILNGAMLFDSEALKPTYRLRVGQPGSSFAFELAKQIGLQEGILSYAGKKAGKESEQVDKLLIQLQEEKKALDEALLNTYDEKERLSRLIENYEKMKQELDIRRKRLKKEAREKTYLNISDTEKEIQKLLRQAKKQNTESDLKKLANKVKEAKSEARDEIKALSDTIFSEEIKKVKDLEVGQYVKLRSGGEAGKVVSFDDKKVKLEMGMIQMEVPRSEILMSMEPLKTQTRSIITDTVNNPYAFESELDIRGYSKAEAEASVQEFLDNALLGSAKRLKVLHGKGSGVLKKVVWAKAREYKDIEKIWHPEAEFGGHGVTFLSF